MNTAEPFPLPEAPNEAEQEVLRAAAEGRVAALRGRTVPAALIRSLLFRGVGPEGGLTPLGLRLQDGWIEGRLDLRGLGSTEAPAPPLALWNMHPGEVRPALELDISGATLAELDLRGSRVASIAAADLTVQRRLSLNDCRSGAEVTWSFDGARIGSHVFLDRVDITGEVRFLGAEVGGGFHVRMDARITRAAAAALHCDGMRVKGDVNLDGAVIIGEIHFVGALIGGQFTAEATITREGGTALNCDGARIGNSVFLTGATIAGEVRFVSAEIGGQFNARNGTSISHEGATALMAAGIRVKGGVLLDGAVVTGEVHFTGAEIGGQFNADTGTSITREGDAALNLGAARIASDVLLGGATIAGEVRFYGAELGGGLYAFGIRIAREGGAALTADRIHVKGDVHLDEARIIGEVRFFGAEIGGVFSAGAGASLSHRHEAALVCSTATIRGGVFLQRARLRGGLNFAEAEVGRILDLSGSRIGSPADRSGKPQTALEAVGLRVGGDLLLGDAVGDLAPNGSLHCAGPIRLDRARIEGALVLNGALLLPSRRDRTAPPHPGRPFLRAAQDPEELVLSLEQARTGARIEVRGLHLRSRGVIDLRGAHTGLLDDAGGLGWGEPCHWSQPPLGGLGRLEGIQLRLDGFTYDRVPDYEDEARVRPLALVPMLRHGWARLRRVPSLLREPPDGSPRHLAVPLLRAPRNALRCKLGEWENALWGGPYRPGNAAVSPRARRHAFLMRQFPGMRPGPNDFSPQPFEHLTALLRAAGHPEEADWFARQKREFRLRCRVDGFFVRLWSHFTGLAFGHYYAPGRAFLTLGLGILLGMGLLFAANDHDMLVVRRQKVELSASQAAFLGGDEAENKVCWDKAGFTEFHLPGLDLPLPHFWVAADAAMVALDTMLPVVELRQDDRCEVDENAPGHEMWSVLLALYSALGLVILPMFLATVTGLLRRD